jgi:hypothetical protein
MLFWRPAVYDYCANESINLWRRRGEREESAAPSEDILDVFGVPLHHRMQKCNTEAPAMRILQSFRLSVVKILMPRLTAISTPPSTSPLRPLRQNRLGNFSLLRLTYTNRKYPSLLKLRENVL